MFFFDIKRRSPYHFPLFDLRIYHNLCFSDFDIKWFVVVLTSGVSCSACLSVSTDRSSARPLTHAQYTQYPFTGQNMVKKLSYQRGGIMLSLYISLFYMDLFFWKASLRGHVTSATSQYLSPSCTFNIK